MTPTETSRSYITIRHGEHDYRIGPNGHIFPTKAENPNPPNPLEYTLPTTALEWDFGRRIRAADIASPNSHDPLLAHLPAPVVDAVLGKTGVHDPTSVSPELTHESVVTNDFDVLLERTSPQFTENWKYDANGNEVEHRDRDGRVYRSIYNSWNSLWQSIDPLGNVSTFDITVQGLVARFTDPGGAVTEYEWDLEKSWSQFARLAGSRNGIFATRPETLSRSLIPPASRKRDGKSALATSSKL